MMKILNKVIINIFTSSEKRQIQIYLNERNFICFIAKLFIRNFFIIFRVVKRNPVLQIDSSFFQKINQKLILYFFNNLKLKKTSEKYPRKTGIPAKKPL